MSELRSIVFLKTLNQMLGTPKMLFSNFENHLLAIFQLAHHNFQDSSNLFHFHLEAYIFYHCYPLQLQQLTFL